MDFIPCSGAGMRFAFGAVAISRNKAFQSLSECPIFIKAHFTKAVQVNYMRQQ
jgi:hypothetical protein